MTAACVLTMCGLSGVEVQSADAAPAHSAGYWLVAGDGGIFSFGPAALFQGSAGGIHLNQPIVGMAPTADGAGYWLVARDGGVFTYGDAVYHGSTGAIALNQPIVGMAATPDGGGYWLLAADGGVFNFGDAAFFGSAVGQVNGLAVAIASDPAGTGYWIADQAGHVFPFNAANLGSGEPADISADPVAGMAAIPGGYWTVTHSGHVGAFGNAPRLGQVTTPLNAPVVGMAATPDGGGYYVLARDGGIFSFGDATFFGSTGNLQLNSPVLGLAVPTRPAGGAIIHLESPNSGDVVAIHPSDTVTVTLNTCFGCGDASSLTTQPEPTIVAFAGEQQHPNGHDPAFEVQVYTFNGVGKGTTSAVITHTSQAMPSTAYTFGFDVVP